MFISYVLQLDAVYQSHLSYIVSLDDSIVLALLVCEVPNHIDLECQLEPTSLFFFSCQAAGGGGPKWFPVISIEMFSS